MINKKIPIYWNQFEIEVKVGVSRKVTPKNRAHALPGQGEPPKKTRKLSFFLAFVRFQKLSTNNNNCPA